jgi:3-hydroxyisobutyrate dehydrogenase-like beta-hydroxyacid dehydrogenase
MREHAARGGVLARSPADAAHGASVLITCLMTGELVREVLLGPDDALESASPGLVVVDQSTIHPEALGGCRRGASRTRRTHARAPVGGPSGQARRREAPVVVGGDPEVFARCRPSLDAVAQRVHHMGANGAGARVKLVINLILGLNRLALASERDNSSIISVVRSSSRSRRPR